MDIGLRRPTLDDVFLQLTGAPASENGSPPLRAARQPTVKPRRARIRLGRPPPSAWRGDIPDAAVVTGRNLRHFIREPQLLIFSTIQPVMFVLLFVYVFGGALGGSIP